MKPLYLDDLPALEKKAGFASRLSETPENWPQEITSDLYKQLPYLTDYEVMVNLDRAEEQRGYAYGYADVANRTERPEAEHDEAGLPHIRIPIIVQEKQVRPFTTFLDGDSVYPLTENRLREKLFNPTTFDLSVQEPKDPSLIDNTTPPARMGYGMGGEIKQASISKEAFKHISKEQWQAIYKSDKIQQMLHEYKDPKHPAVQNRVYELAAGIYGFHPKPEPPSAMKMQEMAQKQFEKTQKKMQKQQQKAAVDKVKSSFGKTASLAGSPLKPPPGSLISGEVNNPVPVSGTHSSVTPGRQGAGPIGKHLKSLIAKMKTKSAAHHLRAHTPNPRIVSAMKGAATKGLRKMPKLASGEDSLLLAIAPTIRESDRTAFINKLANDVTLRAAFERNGMGPLLVEVFGNTKTASAEDRLRAVAEAIEPTCVSVTKLPGGDFLVKSANNEMFNPADAAGDVVPQEEAADAIGPDAAQQMQPGQTATAVANPVDEMDLEGIPQNAQGISEFGEYLVQDKMGNQILGWVFPETLAWDGQFTPTPVALFTNGSAFAIQDGGIQGEFAGKSMQLPMTDPIGEGCFYNISRDAAIATAPVMVRNGMTDAEGGIAYHAMDMFGNPLVIHLSEGLAQPMQVSDNEYAIPSSWKFMALNGQTQLAGGEGMQAADQMKMASQKVTLFWNGSFNLEGGCGLEKVAEKFRYDLDPISAEFMLGVLGVDGVLAKQKLAHARKHGQVDLYNLKEITPLGEHYKAAVKTASAFLAEVPDLRRDLVKEAASLSDEASVDKVLALNFINPENLATFVDYLPQLEETSERFAEMLLCSYLGQNEIPGEPVERAMKNIEEVATALRAVQAVEA